MARVEILRSLKVEIIKKFKKESNKIFNLMYSLEENPHKGKVLGHVADMVIKELKYKSFRFYFITDGNKLRIMSGLHLEDLLIRFVRMSDKKDLQKAIEEIRNVLLRLGEEGF